MSFDATIGAPTKVELGDANGEGGYKVLWSKGDKIAVFGDTELTNGNVNPVEFVTDIEVASSNASFTGSIDVAEKYYAVYPLESAINWAEYYKNITVSLSATQKACGISSGIAVATAKGSSLQFEHMTGYVKFTIPDEYTDIKEVRFSGNNDEPLAGQYYFYPDGSNPNAFAASKLAQLSLVPSEGEVFAPGSYYFTTFPASLSGLSITFVKSDDSKATKSADKAAEIKAGDILNLGIIDDLTFVSTEKETWSKITKVAQIVDGEYVILAECENNKGYGYFPSKTTDSSPLYTPQTIFDVSTAVVAVPVLDNDMRWVISKGSDGKITIKNKDGKYLYCTNDNKGLKVGETKDTWTIEAHKTNSSTFSLKSTNNQRYVGVYNKADWRSYTSVDHDNYANGKSSQLVLYYCGTIVQKNDQSLSFAQSSYNATLEQDFESPKVKGAVTDVTYFSSNEDVATVDPETGEITLVSAGTTVISAVAEENETYYSAIASYDLNVAKPEIVGSKTVTYTITATNKVSVSGDEVPNTSASYSSTYNEKNQLTKGNSMTLTLNDFSGITIKEITLSMKSNKSSGSGYYSTKVGSNVISSIGSSGSGVAFNKSSWYGAWSTSYVDITPNLTETTVSEGEAITIVIGATANSLYCQSISITYTN